jgi:hypothetical protein
MKVLVTALPSMVGRARMRDRPQDVEAQVSASFGPFVGLLGQDGAHEADDALPVGEDPDGVGAAGQAEALSILGDIQKYGTCGTGCAAVFSTLKSGTSTRALTVQRC